MDKPKMTYYGIIERYEMLLPDGSEVIVDAHDREEGKPYIEIRNKKTNEIIENFPYLAYVKRYLFENSCFYE